MAKAPFFAKDGIKTPSLEMTGDVGLDSAASLKGKNSSGVLIDLIRPSNNNVVIGDADPTKQPDVYIRAKNHIYHNPSVGVDYKVYTEGFKPSNFDIENKQTTVATEHPDKTWVTPFAGIVDGLPAYSTIVNLSSDADHGVQLATHYGAGAQNLWFRSRSDNTAAVNGRGLQPWLKVFHEGHKPTAADIGAAPVEAPEFINTDNPDKAVMIKRLRDSKESLRINVTDTMSDFWYNNDETSGTMRWRISNSGVEGGNEAGANEASMRFTSEHPAGASLRINEDKVYHEGFKPTSADVGALPITGGTLTGELNIGHEKVKIYKTDLFTLHATSAANINIHADADVSSNGEYVSVKAGSNELKVISTAGDVDAEKLTYNGFKVYHEGFRPSAGEIAGVLPLTGGSLTGDLTINKVSPVLTLRDADIVKGTQPTIKFTSANNQGVEIKYNEHDDELAQTGYALRIQRASDNVQSYAAHLEVEGVIYELDNKRVYSEGHKPTPAEIGALGKTENAKSASNWANLRKLTLSGDVTGNVSFDGSGDMALTTTVKDNSHAHTISNVTGLTAKLDTKLDKTAKAADSALLNGHNDYYSPRNKPAARDLGASMVAGNTFNLHEFPAADSNYAPYGDYWLNGTTRKGMVYNLVKRNTVGVDSSVSYAGLLTMHPWSDSSGGQATQLTHSGNNLWLRGGTDTSGWDSSWARVYTTAFKPTLDDVGGVSKATTDSLYLPKTSNAVSATKLKTARTISCGSDATGSVQFDGTSNITLPINVKNDSHNHSHSTISGVSHTENSLTRLLYPHGASYRVNSASVTGAIKIRLPVSWSNTMMTLKISLFDYTTNEACELLVSGYNFNSTWQNTSAVVLGSLNNRRFKVRFGHDGSKCCILIGETTQTWSYPQVTVTECVLGHQAISESQWDDGWVINTVTSLPSNIDTTHVATLPVAEGALSAAKWSTPRKITLTGGATGNVTLDGSGNVNLPVTIGTHTHTDYLPKDGKAANSEKLDGRDSTGYAKVDTVQSHLLTPGKWYRIASGTARLNAEFTVMDGAAGVHGYTRFQAGASYGNAPFINVMNSTRHGSSGVISKVRLVTNKADPTYGEVSLEVYCETAGVITTCMTNDLAPHNGWVLRSTVTDQTAMTDNVRSTVDIKNNHGIQSNHRMISAGGYVYSTTDKPTADDIGALGKTERAADSAKLVGRFAATAATPSTIAERDSSGDLSARLFRSTHGDDGYVNGGIAFRVNNSTDNYTRYCNNKGAIRTYLDVPTVSQVVTAQTDATVAKNTANTAKALVDKAWLKTDEVKAATLEKGEVQVNPRSKNELNFKITQGNSLYFNYLQQGGNQIESFRFGNGTGGTSPEGGILFAKDYHASGRIFVGTNGELASSPSETFLRNNIVPASGYRSITIHNDGTIGVYSDTNGFKKLYHEAHKPTAADVGAYTKAEVDAKVAGGTTYEWQYPALQHSYYGNRSEVIKWKFLDHNTIQVIGIGRQPGRTPLGGVTIFDFPSAVAARITSEQYSPAVVSDGGLVTFTAVSDDGRFRVEGSSNDSSWVMVNHVICLDQ